MRSRHILCWSTLVATAFIFGGPVLSGFSSTESAADGVPMRIGETGLPTVRVRINGTGPYVFVVDTGSNRTAVTPRLTARLGLRAMATTELVTPDASAASMVVALEEITVGPVTRRALPAAVLPDQALTALKLDADGLLGQDFLRDDNYSLDYARGRLLWNDAAASDRHAIRLTMRTDEGRWLVALPQEDTEKTGGTGTSEPMWFVPDSGAQALVLFDRGQTPRLTLSPLARVTPSTVLGTSRARASIVKMLRIGTLTLRDQPAVVIDRREPDAPFGDGLLPLSGFSRVTFLGTEQTLVVYPR